MTTTAHVPNQQHFAYECTGLVLVQESSWDEPPPFLAGDYQEKPFVVLRIPIGKDISLSGTFNSVLLYNL